MKTADVTRTLSILSLRSRYLHHELTPEEVIQQILHRVHTDSDMNIWITPPSMETLRPYLDRLATLDMETTPLWGIPFAVKDNIDVAGLPTTAGCPEYAYTPTAHAAVVERLVAAGAIPLGKTNLDQFATGLVGTRSPYGETHNALRGELISGGSSSGSAVAVARGHAAFALGTDTAGSGRVPAALNRLVGYKPSVGAWPTKGVVPACASLDCVTVFTHTLADALVVNRVARGVHDSDPWSRPLPLPTLKRPRKLCLPKQTLDFYGLYADGYQRAWEAAIEQVKKLGISIEYVDVDLFSRASALLYEGPWVAERWASLGAFVESHPGATFPVTEQILRSGAGDNYDAASVFQAFHQLQSYKLEARKLLQDAVLIMPTAGGTWSRDEVRKDPVGTNRDMGKYTNHCNLLDLCAIAVPAGDAAPDTPFGITLYSLAENEGLIQAVAAQYTDASTEISDLEQMGGVYTATSATETQDTTLVAVCGLHMRGFPLEAQMLDCGASFVREDVTAARYRMVKLPTTPPKPGLIKCDEGGSSIEVEIWRMPWNDFGRFVATIPAPLSIGKIELMDGSEVPGFLCESYATTNAEDITEFGGWRNQT
jgi:allophanate hydrolase